MIDSLLKKEKYPDNPEEIKYVQTHISNVFISKELVYKIKKPVDFGFLDFTTIDKRKYFCEREIELNSRLSPDIYIKVVTVNKVNDEYFFDLNKGEVVDYAVVMKRIDESNLLKNLLKENRADKDSFKKIAESLYEFHKKYPANEKMAKEFGSIELLKFTTDENFSQTEKYINITIKEEYFNAIKEFTNNFYKNNEALFEERILKKMIKEAHGDLHLEHVGIANGECFFLDCIEFNDRFRIIDVANEIAFLSMDLDYNNYFEFSDFFIEYYRDISKDNELLKLIQFYKIYRAYVRGKVTSFLLDDPNIPEQEKKNIKERAAKYFNLAYRYMSSAK
jgi:aminoglycoside phosphotransferase family enzyme